MSTLAPVSALLGALAALSVLFMAAWYQLTRGLRRGLGPGSPATEPGPPSAFQLLLGFVTNFFDSLGISSFATTTAVFRLRRMVPDRIIPGTLNVGHMLPTAAQAFVYTSIIPVDVLTLVAMIGAAVGGAWLGAGAVARWPRRRVQLGMGTALLAAAAFMLMRQMGLFPPGSEAIGVRGFKLALAVGANFVLGALMTLGIGLYAPCMILVSLLGMSERTAFPIMMGSCAFLMPVGSLRFIREGAYSLRNALGLAIAGVPGVLVAAYIVRQLDLYWVRWLVVAVVLYTAVSLLWTALADDPAAVAERRAEASG